MKLVSLIIGVIFFIITVNGQLPPNDTVSIPTPAPKIPKDRESLLILIFGIISLLMYAAAIGSTYLKPSKTMLIKANAPVVQDDEKSNTTNHSTSATLRDNSSSNDQA